MTDSREKALLCVEFALDKKAHDVVVMEVGKLTSLADYFVVCTGRSDTQVQAITQGIEESLREHGIRPTSIEGYTRGQWVIMDYADVLVHIFYEPVREFYDLDRLWARAPRLALPDPQHPHTQALHLAERGR